MPKKDRQNAAGPTATGQRDRRRIGTSVALKQRLAENIPSCPLFSTAAIARNLEAAYLGMIENSRSARP